MSFTLQVVQEILDDNGDYVVTLSNMFREAITIKIPAQLLEDTPKEYGLNLVFSGHYE